MPKIISDRQDSSAMSVFQADALFREIALLTIRINRIQADYESRIAGLKAEAEQKTTPLKSSLERLDAILRRYILSNPGRFIKPRQHVTEYGKYGVRSVSSLEISDIETVKAAVRAQNIPALITIEHLDKKILEKAISEGKEIEGCAFRWKEIVCYTVSKALPEE